jgi:hypothetical protein
MRLADAIDLVHVKESLEGGSHVGCWRGNIAKRRKRVAYSVIDVEMTWACSTKNLVDPCGPKMKGV